ncbi:phosphoribosyltransferase [Candidatus Microgenomates bacterium]|nr:phosphoribosyltransferase [Candidatus Microgenomates bacterium]
MFQNRSHAGQLLGEKLEHFKGEDVIVLAIPRGGVVVGAEIAKVLDCPLDIIVTKKIGAPGNPELAVGAMGSGGEVIWDENLLSRLSLSKSDLTSQIKNAKLKMQSYVGIKAEHARLKHRHSSKFKVKEKNLKNKTVILTDDGIATGATVEVAIKVIKAQKPKKLIVAMPVAPPETVKKLKPLVDEFICLATPAIFWAVGQFYQEFEQVEDEEVIKILRN